MKKLTKEEIMKMTKKELLSYKSVSLIERKCSRCVNCSYCSSCFDCLNCFCCSYCFNCIFCSDCKNCSNCFGCWNLNDGTRHEYKICNVQFTKEEYEKKIKELTNEENK